MGKAFASEIKSFPLSGIDFLIPVPLHPEKLGVRGYNQSEMIAAGMSMILNKQMITNILSRKVYTDTQTRKSRYERFKNTEGKFEVKNSYLVENKHIMLVDDVITTGSTIESCARILLNIPGVKVSASCLAVA